MNLQYTFYIKASPERIWTIIAGKETKKIFFGAEIISTYTKGEPLKYIGLGRDGNNTLHIYGQVLEYSENKLFSHTSIVGKVYRGDLPEYESVITYTLEDMTFATKLTVDHTDWDKNDPSYENTKNNWWLMLSNIKTLAETGEALDIGQHE